MKPLSLDWFKDVPPEKKASMEEVLRNSTIMAEQLRKIVDAWEDELNRTELTLKDLDAPNWTIRQAARIGDRTRIKKLRELLNF